MRNRMATALAAVKRRKRGTASVVSVAAIGALALGTLGAGTAAAHGMVGSPDIENQSIRSWDVHRDAIGQSELRGAHDDRGPAVKSHQVKDNNLLHYDIKDGTIREKDLNPRVQSKLDAKPMGAQAKKLGQNVTLPLDTRTQVASVGVGGGNHLITAQVTLANVAQDGDDAADNQGMCFLSTGGGNDVSHMTAQVGTDAGQARSTPMTLTAVVDAGKEGTAVNVECKISDGNGAAGGAESDRYATDISVTGVQVGAVVG